MSRYLRADMCFSTSRGRRIVLKVLEEARLVELINPDTKEVELLSDGELRAAMSDGTFVLEGTRPIGSVAIASETDAALKVQHRKLLVVDALRRHLSRGATPRAAVSFLIECGLQDSDGKVVLLPSARTMFRWLRETRGGNKTLLPRFDQRGNRKPRYPELLKALILQLTEEYYAQSKSRFSLAAITEEVVRRARANGLLPPRGRVSMKYVRRIVVTLWHPDLDFRRLDPRLAKAVKAVAAERIRVTNVLQRVEMDTVHLPFVVRVHDVIYSTVYLMLAIDCATSVIVSWWFMLATPTTEDTLACVNRMLFSKRKALADLGVKATVDPYGLCVELVVDNGSENRGPRIDNLSSIGINLTRTPANSPQKKPFIERLMRSLKTGLEILPGCTRFNGRDGARTEEALHDKLLTPGQLEAWVVRWIFEEWANKPLQRFVSESYHLEDSPGLTPADRWRHFEKTQPVPLPPNRAEVAALTYLKAVCGLSPKTGVSLLGFRFRGENLRRLIQEYGPNAKVEVFYDPNDYRFVKVRSLQCGELLVLINDDALVDGPAYTFAQFKATKSAKDAQVTAMEPHPDSVRFQQELADGAYIKPKGRVAKKAQHEAVRVEQALDRARNNPLPANASPKFAPISHIAEDAIPAFSVSRSAGKSARRDVDT